MPRFRRLRPSYIHGFRRESKHVLIRHGRIACVFRNNLVAYAYARSCTLAGSPVLVCCYERSGCSVSTHYLIHLNAAERGSYHNCSFSGAVAWLQCQVSTSSLLCCHACAFSGLAARIAETYHTACNILHPRSVQLVASLLSSGRLLLKHHSIACCRSSHSRCFEECCCQHCTGR